MEIDLVDERNRDPSSSSDPTLDEIDFEIINLLSKKYKKSGLNIVRYDTKNPYLRDLVRLANEFQDKDIFRKLTSKKMFSRTKYSAQYQIQTQ